MGKPHYPPDFGTLINGLRRSVRDARTQATTRQPFRTIKAEVLSLIGNLVVAGGGTITVKDSAGNVVALVGDVGDKPGTTTPMTGIRVYRPDGTVSLSAYTTADGTYGISGFNDDNNRLVIGPAVAGAEGMAVPWVPLPTPVASSINKAGMPQTTLTTWTSVARADGFLTHGYLYIKAFGYVDTGTTGQYRVMVNGTQVGPTVSVGGGAGGTISGSYPVPGWTSTLFYLSSVVISIEAQVTGGTGTVYVQPTAFYGRDQ